MSQTSRVLVAMIASLGWGMLSAAPADADSGEASLSVVEALKASQSVMFVGAHADDENSSSGFIARSAGAGKEVTIVCFTLGQNEPMDVGVPKGRAMGEARARWLRDSAAVLGADRVVQLPYTDGPLTVEELEQGGIRYWPRDTTVQEVLAQWRKIGRDPYEDMIRVIRSTRPDLIVTWEKTTGWTGNSEHKLVGWLAERAYLDAGNPDVFPGQIENEGLEPWNPKYLVWVVSGPNDGDPDLPVETVSCNVPGPGGLTACETKVMGQLTYAANWGRSMTDEQKQAMLDEAGKLKEHFQLARHRAEERP